MTVEYEDEIPPNTLPGAQNKFQATLTKDGRYVVESHVNTDPIPAWKVVLRDPKPLAEFVNIPGPPSIVDTIIAELHAASAEDLQRVQRGELTTDGAVEACLQRYSEADQNRDYIDEMQRVALRRRRGFFEAGELVTAETLSKKLGISLEALERAVLEHRLFAVPGPQNEIWYPVFFADANHADIECISVELQDMSAAAKWQFFTTPKHSLGGDTPLVALQLENFDMVLRTAVQFRERSRGR